MLLPILSFVGGVSGLQVQPRLPALSLACLLLIPLLAFAVRSRQPFARGLRMTAVCVAAAGAGFFWAALLATERLADALPHAWEGRDIRLVGVIARLPQRAERGIRFEIDVERIRTPEARVPRRVALTWYGALNRDAPAETLPELQVGERWELTVRLRRPHGTSNPHGFDYEAWLLERGIRATGYVRLQDAPRRAEPFVFRPGYVVERIRALVRQRILDALEDRPLAGVIAALVMGDQRAIPPAQWTVFTRTGVNHLMSISGLHVTMIAALVYTLTYGLWRRSPRMTLRVPARRAAVLAGLLSAVGYAAVAGFAVPAQRTVYMLAVAAVALWLGQLSSAASILCVALLVVTVLDPWAVLAPGFWLSFGAVAVILYVSIGPLRTAQWAIAWARTQWAVTLGLMPLMLAMFQQVSLVSPVANALAIPLISLVVVPLALIGTVTPLDIVLRVAHSVMEYTMRVLEWLGAVPDSVWQQHAPPAWTIALGFLGVVWLLLPRGFPGRWLGLVLLAPLFTEVPPGPESGALRLTVLDVGQGLSVVIRTARHALLYDAGPVYSADADSGSRIVVPYLRATGVRKLDGVIVSHADNDHAGGAASVLAAVPVRWLASSLPPEHPLHAASGRSVPCYAGQHWEWDGVRFEMLHPDWASYSIARMRANDRSCVLRITAPGQRVLIAGDAEARSEREMLARLGDRMRAEMLVVPHHGSTTSSTAEFIAGVAPQNAIFTVGYRNRFGHPRPEVLQRYLDYGTRLLRTDHHGALTFDIDSTAVMIRAHRDERRRYWQDPPTATEESGESDDRAE